MNGTVTWWETLPGKNRRPHWSVSCKPHVMVRLKRWLPRVDTKQHGIVFLADTPETARDLMILLLRHPMKISPDDRRHLESQAQVHIDREELTARILSKEYTPKGEVKLAEPARGYQDVAADLAIATGQLLLADDLGLGKTISAINMLAKSGMLPALVVTLTHLPRQWQRELARFTPDFTTHVLEKAEPYDLAAVRKRRRKLEPNEANGVMPDVIIANYHKLGGWAQTLAELPIRSVVFDECQELRSGAGTHKYEAAKHIADRAQLRLGLSVGPATTVELYGGPFGFGFIGSIEDAWRQLESLPKRSEQEYEVVACEGQVWARGWDQTLETFRWARVKDFIRHQCDKPVRELTVGGVDLLLTDDHSVWMPTDAGIVEVLSEELRKGDVLLYDPGWESPGEEPLYDILQAVQEVDRLQVVVDLTGKGRDDFGFKAWEWQNLQREATYGDRLPAHAYLSHRDSLPEPTKVYVGRGKAPALPAKVYLSDWAYILGFYLGNGWSSSQVVGLAVHSSKLQRLLRKIESLSLGFRPRVREMPGDSAEVRLSHRLFAEVICQVFKGAKSYEKEMPGEWIVSWPRVRRRELLEGLLDSDGHRSKRKGARTYSTTSRLLACSVRVLLRSLGYKAGIHLRKPSEGGVIDGRSIVGRRPSYQVTWSSGEIERSRAEGRRFQWTRGKALEVKIHDVKPATPPEWVYDLCMEEHPSFAADGILAHNSATPIYNYGGEIYNVLNVICPDVLGTPDEFYREWCTQRYGERKPSLRDPKMFGEFVRDEGLMLRRTRADAGRELEKLNTFPIEVETDKRSMAKFGDEIAALARTILSTEQLERGAKFRASGALDYQLRRETGMAKASFTAAFVRGLVDSGESVVLYGWHHDVYEVWRNALKDLEPAFFTGKESPAAKELEITRFKEGKTKVAILSLRAGAGLDGLQHVCRTVVFGELDWSPGVHEQAIGRVYRDGQPDPVMVYFLIADSGSDPIIADTLGVKRGQINGLRDPDAPLVEAGADPNHMRKLAEEFLRQRGELQEAS